MTNIAIFGVNGALAEPTLTALQSPLFAGKVNYPIKVVSRKPQALTSKILYITSDLTNTAELAEQLKGTNVFIELLPPIRELFALIEKLSAVVKPELFIPSQFGADVPQVIKYIPEFYTQEPEHSTNLRALGIKVVDVVTGFFSSPVWLHQVVSHAGVNPEDKTYTVLGDINQKFSVTTVEDIGKTIAAVATHSNFKSIPDNFRVYSELVTPQKVIDLYEKNNNVKLTKKDEFTAEEALKQLTATLTKGFFEDQLLYYLHVIVSQGLDKGLYFSENLREFINPNESVWKWGKYE